MRRVVVVQADARSRCGLRAPLSVGIARWRGCGDLLSVVVKLTLSLAAEAADAPARVVEPEPVRGARKSELYPGWANPHDFLVQKARCDLCLHGHAHAASPTHAVRASLSWGDIATDFEVRRSEREPSRLLPLAPGATFSVGRGEPRHFGVSGVPREGADDHPDEFDFTRLQAGSYRVDGIPIGGTLILEGLSPAHPRRVATIPPLVPRAFFEGKGYELRELPLFADTILLDTDHQRLELVYRRTLPDDLHDALVNRIVVSLEGEQRSLAAIGGDLPRGTVSFALEEDPEAPPGDPDELELARYECLEYAAPPEGSLERFATISAELAEEREEREAVLARHDLDERSWTIEERAWAERVAREAQAGDGTLADELATLFAAAQANLAGPDEPRPLDEYVALARAMAGTHDPKRVLREAEVGLGEWSRLERHWQEAAAHDPEVAEALDGVRPSPA